MYIYTIILTWLKHRLIWIGCFYWNILYMKTFIIWSVKGHFRFRRKYKMNNIRPRSPCSSIYYTCNSGWCQDYRTNTVTEINMLQAFTMYYQKPLIDIYMDQLPTEQALLNKKKISLKMIYFQFIIQDGLLCQIDF